MTASVNEDGDAVDLPASTATDLRPSRETSRRRARVLLGACGAMFMIMLDSNIVSVSLPSIAENLGASFDQIEWVISSYILSFAALLLAAGTLADRYGRRRLLVSGLTLFTFASALCGIAPNAAVLNAARALQGVGAAMQLSAGLAVISDEFRGVERARAFAFVGTVLGVAVAAGPLVGGFITSFLGWRWAFLINVPVGAAFIATGWGAIKESSDPGANRLDIAGMFLLAGGLFSIVWALIGGNVDGWDAAATEIKICAGLALLLAFVAAEFFQLRPMVDFGLFRNPTFLGSGIAMLGFASTAQVMMTFLPQCLHTVYGLSPAVVGLGMLPFAVPLLLFPRLAAVLGRHISGRAVLTIGLAAIASGDLTTAVLVGARTPYWVVAIGMFVIGCGAGLINGETTKVQMSVVPPERGGMAAGIAGTLRFVGLLAGVTGLGAILATQAQQEFVRASAKTGIDLLFRNEVQSTVSRIVAGDVAGVVAQTQEHARVAMLEAARSSFSAGFSTVLFVAAGAGALAALLTWILVSSRATAPVRMHDNGNSLAVPEMLD